MQICQQGIWRDLTCHPHSEVGRKFDICIWGGTSSPDLAPIAILTAPGCRDINRAVVSETSMETSSGQQAKAALLAAYTARFGTRTE